MIITEEHRYALYDLGLRDIASNDIKKILSDYDKELTVLWDIDNNQWQFYRIKIKGVTKDKDLLHFQITAPTVDLSSGIIDWLKTKDTNPLAYKSQDEMKDRWLKAWKHSIYKAKEDKQKKLDDIQHGWQDCIKSITTNRDQISVPITVGFSKQTGKKIYAVKKVKKNDSIIQT